MNRNQAIRIYCVTANIVCMMPVIGSMIYLFFKILNQSYGAINGIATALVFGLSVFIHWKLFQRTEDDETEDKKNKLIRVYAIAICVLSLLMLLVSLVVVVSGIGKYYISNYGAEGMVNASKVAFIYFVFGVVIHLIHYRIMRK